MRFAYLRGLLPLLLLLVSAVWAGSPSRPTLQSRGGSAIYRQLLTATAWIHAPDQGKGTGWVLDTSRRWLITNYHVVGENETVDVVFPCTRPASETVIAERAWYLENLARLRETGQVVRGRVLRRSRHSDLALVELPALPSGVTALPLARRSARPGERVHVVGNRYDCESLWAYTSGAVRQVRTLREGYFNGGRQLAKGARVVVAQTPINEGDSGAALVNERGEVVGVAAAVAWEMQGAGLFIDVQAVRELAALPAGEQGSSPEHPPASGRFGPRGIYARGLRSVVFVQAPPSDRHASGFLLDRSRRLVLTTSEGVGKQETVEVTAPVWQDGQVVADAAFYRQQDSLLRQKKKRVRGAVLATDERRNLALVELESVPDGMIAVRFAAAPLVPGDGLHGLSNPSRMDVLWVYTASSVRQLAHVNLGQTTDGPDPMVVLLQATLGEGDGGAPLFNAEGELAGVVSGKSAPQQEISYAVTSHEVRDFLVQTRPRWTPTTAAELVERGILFSKARQYERALLDLNAAIHVDPRHAPAYCERGRIHHLLELNERARTDCERALEIDAKLTDAYVVRAEVRCGRGELAQALSDCDTALRLDPHNARAFSMRGRVRLLRDDPHGALADCDEAIWLDRQLPSAPLHRGQVHARNGEHDKAIADFSQALRLDPRLAEVYRCRGDSYWMKSDIAMSLADHEEALKLNPNDVLAWFGRGRGLLARGEHERALADFTQALRLRATLAVNILQEIDRRAAELCQEEKGQPERCCTLLRQGLLAVQPFFKDRKEIQASITAGLQRAGRETDLRQRTVLLRQTIATLR